MNSIAKPDRHHRVKQVFVAAVGLLLLKVFVSILWEYRWYFPANFDSAFLGGRRYTFHGIYYWAFYLHIVSGPMVIVLGCVSILRVRVVSLRKLHRPAGRVLVIITVFVMLPSGLVMATEAYGGPIAKSGFACLAIATTLSVVMTATQARFKKFRSHQRWAARTFILLLSPLVLRLIAGVMIVTGLESQETYQMNAWISWLLPLLLLIGCENRSAPGPIDTTDAGFSTANDYAAYDEEMIELANGQTEQ